MQGVDAGVAGSTVGVVVIAAGIISRVGLGEVTGAGVVTDGFAFTFGFIHPAVVMKSSIKKNDPNTNYPIIPYHKLVHVLLQFWYFVEHKKNG